MNIKHNQRFRRHLITKVVLLCVPLVSVAQEQPCLDSSPYETTKIRVGGLTTTAPSLYFLNRSPTPIYPNDTTSQVAELSKKPLGSPFFGVKGHKTEKRVKLGRYDDKQDCFTEVLGWVAKQHLLDSRKPLRVGDVVKRFPRLTGQTPTGQAAANHSKAAQQQMSEINRLFLRVLSRPEFRFELATAPSVSQQAPASEIKIAHLGHLWRYVYAVEEINQQLWYLVGSKSILIDRRYILKIDDTITKEVRQVLLGWIPRRQVNEWSSNVVLEPNTDEKAVRERYDNDRMATIYKEADENSPIIAQENKELWKSAIAGKVDHTTQASFAPLGLAPEIARYFVKGYNYNTGWYHVACVVGASQENPLTSYVGRSTFLKQQELTNHAAAQGTLAFVEGHTPKRMLGSYYDTYREVALIERRDLRALYYQAASFLHAFDQSLSRSRGNPRTIIAVALLQAVAEVSGNDKLLDDIEDMPITKLRRYARRWLNQRRIKDNSLAELIGLQDSLPIPSEGLFGMTPKDIQRLPPDKILVERDMLALKQICIKKILGGETVPQDVNKCRVHRGQKKAWNYQPAGSSNTYIYLPLHLVP